MWETLTLSVPLRTMLVDVQTCTWTQHWTGGEEAFVPCLRSNYLSGVSRYFAKYFSSQDSWCLLRKDIIDWLKPFSETFHLSRGLYVLVIDIFLYPSLSSTPVKARCCINVITHQSLGYITICLYKHINTKR